MSADRDVTRIVRSWLREDGSEDAERVLFAVIDQLDTTPQRRSFGMARRFPLMHSSTTRIGVAAIAALVVALLGYALISRPDVGDGLTPSASPVPSAAVEIPVFHGGDYEPGRYFIAGGGFAYDWFGLDVSAQVPQGWTRGNPQRGDFGIAYQAGSDSGPRMEMQFWLVDNVTAGGCVTGWPHAGLDPPVGPMVDDLASALTALPGFESTPPVDTTLDGWHGKRLDLTLPEGFECDLELFAWSLMPDPSWTPAAGNPGTHQLWILDVNGTRFVIDAAYDAGTPTELQAELQQIVDSIDIEPRAGP